MEQRELLPSPEKRMRSYVWIVVAVSVLIIAAASAAAIVGRIEPKPDPGIYVNTPVPAEPAATAAAAPDVTPEPLPTASAAASQPVFVKTALVIDGDVFMNLSSREAAEQLIINVQKHFESLDDIPSDAVTVLQNEIEFVDADPEANITDYEVAFSRLVGAHTPLVFESTASFFQEQIIEHSENVTYTDALPSGYRLVKVYGMDGLIRIIYSATYVNGERITLDETDRIIVHPAVDGEVLIGSADTEYFAAGESGFAALVQLPEGFSLVVPAGGRVALQYGFYDGEFHHGIDIASEAGTRVAAPADGIVVSVMERGTYGIMVEIDHGDGVTTRCARLSGVCVTVGDRVSAGDKIGEVAHDNDWSRLHFELRRNGYSFDPIPCFSDAEKLYM